jgi:hypothetical protein
MVSLLLRDKTMTMPAITITGGAMIININSAREFRSTDGLEPLEIISPAGEPAILRAATAFTRPETHANDIGVQAHLRALRTARRMDGVFVILFDRGYRKIDRLIAPRFDCVVGDPHAMTHLILPCNAAFAQRFAKQQIVEINDISECCGEFELLISCLSNFNLKSLVVGGIVVHDAVAGLFVMGTSRARNHWELDMHLTMRLMTATYAAGLERYLAGQAY